MKPLLCGALVALSLLQALPQAAGAYNPAIVAADARWVVYADLDALRVSTVGKELVAALEKAQSQNTGGIIGLDISKVLTTVGTLTAYGTNLAKDPQAVDGTLIAQGTANLRKIAESVLLQGTLAQPDVFTEVKDLPFPAYAIADPKAPEATRTRLVVAFPPEPIVLISKSRAQLLKARDVFRGSAPSLAKASGSPLVNLGTNAQNASLFSAMVVPTEPIFPENAPQTRMLQLARSGSIAFGERGADTFAHAEMHASSGQNAEKLLKILQGMTAMLSLAESNDRQLAEFLSSAAVTRNDNTVTLNLAYPSARLVQMVQTLQAQAERRPPSRPTPIVSGTAIAEWMAEESPDREASEVRWRTIENVNLTNGAVVTLGRALQGGKNARFDRIEIVSAGAPGAPLIFRPEFMRNVGGRGSMSQFSFPGTDGVYTLKVAYVNDPDGKAKFAVSIRDPRSAESDAAPKKK